MSDWSNIKMALNASDIVLLPTETVYGLAARADDSEAISKIYDIKGRDFDKPLAVCIRNLAQAEMLAYFDETSRKFALQYWPGSLTLVLDARDGVRLDKRVMANTDEGSTIALRCPDTDWIENLDVPLALTSANKSGEPDCVRYDEARTNLGVSITSGLPATAALSGAPSTILRISNEEITLIRQGELVIPEALS